MLRQPKLKTVKYDFHYYSLKLPLTLKWVKVMKVVRKCTAEGRSPTCAEFENSLKP